MPISTKDWHELQDELDNIEGHAVYLIETGRIYQ
ncbi:hypothetical protein FHT44_005077 [Mycolicibacterium sp. BK634]|nr:hypothetical protein [Mycolicibacterium sp. BK634]